MRCFVARCTMCAPSSSEESAAAAFTLSAAASTLLLPGFGADEVWGTDRVGFTDRAGLGGRRAETSAAAPRRWTAGRDFLAAATRRRWTGRCCQVRVRVTLQTHIITHGPRIRVAHRPGSGSRTGPDPGRPRVTHRPGSGSLTGPDPGHLRPRIRVTHGPGSLTHSFHGTSSSCQVRV